MKGTPCVSANSTFVRTSVSIMFSFSCRSVITCGNNLVRYVNVML